MMVPHANTTHAGNESHWTRDHSRMTIDLPADRVLHDSTLIEQMITLAFDRLEHVVVELRVREDGAISHTY